MCGIVGASWPAGVEAPPPDRLEAAVAALRHRGPDDSSVDVLDGVALGHTRLSIIDLAGGSQPIYNEDRSVVTTYNGAIWNLRRRRLLLARDRLGKKPLYYARTPAGLVYGSDVRSVLLAGGVRPEL